MFYKRNEAIFLCIWRYFLSLRAEHCSYIPNHQEIILTSWAAARSLFSLGGYNISNNQTITLLRPKQRWEIFFRSGSAFYFFLPVEEVEVLFIEKRDFLAACGRNFSFSSGYWNHFFYGLAEASQSFCSYYEQRQALLSYYSKMLRILLRLDSYAI